MGGVARQGLSTAPVFGSNRSQCQASSPSCSQTISASRASFPARCRAHSICPVSGLNATRAIPPLAWVPISILFWPTNEASIVFITFIGAFFIIVINVHDAVRAVKKEHVWLALSMGASRLQVFRRIVLPGLTRIVQACERLGMRYIFRTDGSTWKVADMLFTEAGCHGYGEIDYSAGMRLKDIRSAYPRLCLFGNVDCAGVLVSGTPNDVRRATADNLQETLGLGHVLGSSNSIVYETPPDNYLAMLDTARNWQSRG